MYIFKYINTFIQRCEIVNIQRKLGNLLLYSNCDVFTKDKFIVVDANYVHRTRQGYFRHSVVCIKISNSFGRYIF